MATEKKFTHRDLTLPSPRWESSLVSNIIELEKLRDKRIVPKSFDIFFELKYLFQRLETWASARIEGNQTQLVDALDPKVAEEVAQTYDYQELENIDRTIDFIDEYCKDSHEFSRAFILELHKRVVKELPIGKNKPGDRTPGKFRVKQVEITKSNHTPPIGAKVPEYIDELVEFINAEGDKKNNLLKVAIVHHRFTWIHPFTNGNGRVARLITYAMLQMQGFGVKQFHIINPSAVLYAHRTMYYEQLAHADSGSEDGLLQWSDYFIAGLLEEINKIDRLLDQDYVRNVIILPVLKMALEANRITEQEYTILEYSIKREIVDTKTPSMTFAASDVATALGKELPIATRTRLLKRMRTSGLITPAYNYTQRYVIQLVSPLLYRFVIDTLYSQGFIRPVEEQKL